MSQSATTPVLEELNKLCARFILYPRHHPSQRQSASTWSSNDVSLRYRRVEDRNDRGADYVSIFITSDAPSELDGLVVFVSDKDRGMITSGVLRRGTRNPTESITGIAGLPQGRGLKLSVRAVA